MRPDAVWYYDPKGGARIVHKSWGRSPRHIRKAARSAHNQHIATWLRSPQGREYQLDATTKSWRPEE